MFPRPGPAGVRLAVGLLEELLGDRAGLAFLGDDDPRREVSEDPEEAEERGRGEDQPDHGHVEAGVLGQPGADPGDHSPVEGTDQPLAVAVADPSLPFVIVTSVFDMETLTDDEGCSIVIVRVAVHPQLSLAVTV